MLAQFLRCDYLPSVWQSDAKAQQLTLEVDPGATRFLAEDGYVPLFGARPLKRAIQRDLLDPLVTKLLNGDRETESRQPRKTAR